MTSVFHYYIFKIFELFVNDYRHIHHHFHHHHDSSGEIAQPSNKNQVQKTTEVTQNSATPWWGLKRKSPNSESSGAAENQNNISTNLPNNVSGVTAGLDLTSGNLSSSNFEQIPHIPTNRPSLNNLHTQTFNLFKPQPHTFITTNGIHDNCQNSGPSISPIANNVPQVQQRQLNPNVKPPPVQNLIDRSQTIPQQNQPGAAITYKMVLNFTNFLKL